MSSQSPNHDLPDPKRFKAAPATTNNTNTTTSSNIAPSTTTAPAAAAAPTVTSSISNQTTATARPVTASAATTVTTASSVKKASSTTTTAPPATTTSTTTTTTTTATGALQQQIQAQLQQQLQAQLQAAAARGQQANITPEQIQAQAQAMVQAAAQAQAVVSAAKNRGDGLVPMTAQQIAALSQIQAQAIVNARPQTALLASGTPTVDQDGKPVQPTPAQIQHQITLQAQALVHAHTQAQIAAGIYKGDGSANSGTGATAAAGAVAPTTSAVVGGKVGTTASTIKSSITTAGGVNKAGGMTSLVGSSAVTTAPSVNSTGLLSSLTPSQLTQQNSLVSRQNSTREKLLSTQATETNQLESKFQQQNLASAPTPETQSRQELELKALREKHQLALQSLNQTFQKELQELHTEFRKQNAAAEYAGIKGGSGTAVGGMKTAAAIAPQGSGGGVTPAEGEGGVVASATSPAFLEKLAGTLNRFWMDQLQQMRNLGTAVPQTEHDFKNHNDLPLARIKRIMKSDEDVRMISAEAPVLFAKACEMFILELTLRSWSYSENNKRRTLQKEDIKEAIQRTDIFDFLVDVIH